MVVHSLRIDSLVARIVVAALVLRSAVTRKAVAASVPRPAVAKIVAGASAKSMTVEHVPADDNSYNGLLPMASASQVASTVRIAPYSVA